MSNNLKGCEVFISGGNGSLGQTLTKLLLQRGDIKGIRLYSRDEFKAASFKEKIDKWKKEFPNMTTPVSFCVGDVRDSERLNLAMKGVDIVAHCAAMKRIEQCESNPSEAIQTNVLGAENVAMAAIKNNVERVINISTDKAVRAETLYGNTKAVAESFFIHANTYSKGKDRKPMFSCCRYGNIFGSRGSVIQLFREQAKIGKVTITHKDMTRFFISLERVGRFVLHCLEIMNGKEIFVPQMPSISIMEMANFLAPKAEIDVIGLRQSEKIHEELLTDNEGRRAILSQLPDRFKSLSMRGFYTITDKEVENPLRGYTSDTNDWKLDMALLEDFENERFAYY